MSNIFQMECLNVKMLCLGVILYLTIIFGQFNGASADDCYGMSGLLISRIRNLEKRMDIDFKIMKSELKREVNGKKRRTTEDSSLLYEIRTIQTSMQQLFGGLENLKTELLLRQQNVTTSILGTVSALQGAVRVLTNKVDDVQIKLSEVDETVANLTKSVENIDIEITDGSEVPVTVETTPEYSSYNATFPAFYNYTMPPTPGTVRLVGTSGTPNAGTVELVVDGVWGSVCDDDWDRDDAEVVCRMLGYGSVLGVYGEARYGQSSSSAIHLDGIDCNGDESNILDCRHNGIGVTDCSHAEDAGVECSDPQEQTTASSIGIQYRLVDGPDSFSGRVEVRYQGEWGTICDDGFDENEANVVCRSLGISDHGAAKIEAYYGTGSGPILMDGLECSGSESFLEECDFNGWRVNDCSHGEDAGVICGGTTPHGGTTPGVYTRPITTVPDIQYRLVDGPGPYSGRVEVYYGGEWGTVCDDLFDRADAIVLCTSMGLNPSVVNPVVKPEAFYGYGTGSIVMDDLDCNGTESSLDQCPFPGWHSQNCGHSEDVGVDCFGGGSTLAPTPSTPSDSASTTTSEPVMVRLVDGPTELSGRVEVYRDGVWGTVCDDDFDYREAAVICRSLGLSDGVAYKEARFGQGSGPIWLDDLKCGGSETTLGDCRSSGWNNSNCGHEEDAAVECSPAPTTPVTTTTSASVMIRLVDGSGHWEGRLEVYHENEWGTVCDDEFDNKEAEIVCSMLGLKGGKAYQGSEKYGQGNGTILMDDLMCAGDESSLFDCPFNGWGVSNCGHGEDAGVQCVMPVTIESVELVEGESDNVGRVEVTVNGVRGTVCDDDFDFRAATVLCRMLGYMNGGESYIEARYGEGSGQVVLDDVICTGNESSLAECDHREPFTSNCEHDEDVSVKCFLSGTTTGVYISKPPRDAKVAEDFTISFFCEAYGSSPESFHWEKAGRPLSLGSRQYQVIDMTNGSVLRIERAKGKRHNGTFTCVAKTDDDKARSDASLFVYPEDPNGELPRGYPRILKNPVLTSVERDYPFTLTCRAIAGGMSGPLNIYWLKDHTPVNTSDPRVQILQEINGSTVAGSLTIARSQDYDQGKYECVAENEVGVAYSYPVMAYVKVRKVPPHFSKLPEDALVEQGASVNLTCAAVGFPVPRVTWRQEGTRVLDHGDTYFGENGESVLMLTDMQEDSNYTCTATSALGERYNIEANVQVKIKDRRFG